MSLKRFEDEDGHLVVDDEVRDYIAQQTPINEQPTPHFTRLTFPTEQECRDYIAKRSVQVFDEYGRLKPGTDLAKNDDLFLRITYSCGLQPDGTWLLIF